MLILFLNTFFNLFVEHVQECLSSGKVDEVKSHLIVCCSVPQFCGQLPPSKPAAVKRENACICLLRFLKCDRRDPVWVSLQYNQIWFYSTDPFQTHTTQKHPPLLNSHQKGWPSSLHQTSHTLTSGLHGTRSAPAGLPTNRFMSDGKRVMENEGMSERLHLPQNHWDETCFWWWQLFHASSSRLPFSQASSPTVCMEDIKAIRQNQGTLTVIH